jgi:tetratricopeptide (TPR) repeat protein
MKKALVDYTQIISLTDVSVEQVAQTLLNRGVVYGQQGELKKELADYTQLIALPDASPEQVTRALFNRGATYYQKGNLEKAVADYTQLINLQNVPVELVANALFNRAIVYKNQNKIKKEIVDYTQLINLQGAPIESLAKALFYRGVAHGIQDNTKEEIADYTQLIILPDASVDQVASALINRGIIYGRENRIKKALSDFIEVISLKNLPPFLKVRAHLHSGIASIQLNEWSKAKRELKKGLLIDDYSEGFFTLGVLTAFYDTFVDRSIRQKNIAELLEIFKINKLALSELGSSLIEFLGRLFKRDSYLLKDNLVSWRDALGNAMQDIEGLGVTQRIFLVGMEFLLSDNDETVLLDLVESEREILRQTFQLNS